MNSRRGFFQSLVKAAAIIALAPQIAFRTKPETQWIYSDKGVYHFLMGWTNFTPTHDPIDILMDKKTADELNRLMFDYYRQHITKLLHEQQKPS